MFGKSKRILSLILALACLLSLGGGMAEARKDPYTPVRLYMDGFLIGRGYACGEQIYLSIPDVCRYLSLDAVVHYDPASSMIDVNAPGLEMMVERAMKYISVNGRYLFNPAGILYVNGVVYLPMEVLARIFNLTLYLSDEKYRVDLDVSEAEILSGGPTYYQDVYGEENVFWLSKIISSEAKGQAIAGMIGVGNVVLNRVASDKFPDTVFDVVFDTNNGIQFQPVYDKSIYLEPTEYAVVAACLCLEGYNTVDDAIFFVAPLLADDSWFRAHRPYVTTIGNHAFYR